MFQCTTRTRALCAATVLIAVVGCGDSGKRSATATPTATVTATVTPTPDLTDVPLFADPGPYPVGVTRLDMGDRLLEVWYPAEPGSESGMAHATYRAIEFLPDNIVAILPDELKNIVIEMPAYRDLPISAAGPFPIMTFSHGAGGFRLAYSSFLAGIASHGLVVASIDHLEWGLLATLGLPPTMPRQARELVLAVIDLLAAENARAGSPLAGGVDTTRMATTGHSAGAAAAFALPDRPEIKAMIGYATSDANGDMSGKAILLVVGALDPGADDLEQAYEALPPTKRFVSVGNAGHNSYTDTCALIHSGTNIIAIAKMAGFPLPDNLAALALNGCLEENLPPADFWRVVQHFTVAHLRAAFGIGDPTAGLGPGVADKFGGIEVTYRSER